MTTEETMTIVRKVLDDELSELVHAAFRKGCEHGLEVHLAISHMDRNEWNHAMDWMVRNVAESIDTALKKNSIHPD